MLRPSNFRYLNRDNVWLGFHRYGLEIKPDGALELTARPRAEGTPLPENLPEHDGPSGVAVAADGAVWFTDPDGHAIYMAPGCGEPAVRLSVAGGVIDGLDHPRGVAFVAGKRVVAVADSGHHRLLMFDANSLALREIWGATDANGGPARSAEPGYFDTPWSLCTDRTGHLYVLDYGNRRVQKFDRSGTCDLEFLSRYTGSGLVQQPGGLALLDGEHPQLFVLDLASHTIWLFDETGEPIVHNGRPVSIGWPGLQRPMALAADDQHLFIGDNGLRAIVVLHPRDDGWKYSATASDYDAPVGALTIGADGRLAAHAGGAEAPVHFAPDAAFVSSGFAWSDAIDADGQTVQWDRVAGAFGERSAGQFRFFYASSNGTTAPPVNPSAADPFADPRWRRVPDGAGVFRVSGAPARSLFLGLYFASDHTETPSLKQLRADFASDRALARLPAIYREAAITDDYLARWVALYQSLVDEIGDEIRRLPAVFDPQAARPGDLEWLATLLAVDIDADGPVGRLRTSIAQAYDRYRWRGTLPGLVRALDEEAGVRARVLEPIFAGSSWTMPARATCEDGTPLDEWRQTGASMLGISTRLAAMEPEGAVLDSTAILDRSAIATVAPGAPVFEQVAHQLIVLIAAAGPLPARRERQIREIVARNIPAHATFRLEIVTPRLRVGFQARLGVDAILAGDAPPTRLGEQSEVRLAGYAPPRAGTTRLGHDVTV